MRFRTHFVRRMRYFTKAIGIFCFDDDLNLSFDNDLYLLRLNQNKL